MYEYLATDFLSEKRHFFLHGVLLAASGIKCKPKLKKAGLDWVNFHLGAITFVADAGSAASHPP